MDMMSIDPGHNKEIDKVLESGVGNCFVALTSRPGYVGDEIRNKMDYAVAIEGLSVENIKKCSELFLDDKKKRVDLLKQAKEVGIYSPTDGFFQRVFSSRSITDNALLRIPIMLLMTCFIYEKNQSLPKTRTGILRTLYTLLSQRSAVKMSDHNTGEKDGFENTLLKLGKLSWEALKRDELILRKVEYFKEVYFRDWHTIPFAND